MDLTKELLITLNSRGNNFFRVLINYGEIKIGSSSVYVRAESVDGETVPVFGTFSRSGRQAEFKEVPEFISQIEGALLNKILVGIDFSADFPDNDFIIEVNQRLRMINIVQSHYANLVKSIFEKELVTELRGNHMVLNQSQIQTLFDYFESDLSRKYLEFLDSRPLNSFINGHKEFYHLRILGKFALVSISGSCIYNPILKCAKFYKVFKETALYKESQKHKITVDGTEVCILSYREICECLGLNQFINFHHKIVPLLVLGVFNPVKFPSLNSKVYLTEGGVATEEEFKKMDLEPGTFSVVNELYLLINNEKRLLGLSNIEQYMKILGNFRLV